ncbi:MAG: SLC13 family permease [Gammaproteobacteria bacterium]|nr:SLC13 family permease [Gammaproteobacteria bacterium]
MLDIALTITTLISLILLLVCTNIGTDLVFGGAIVLLITFQVITPEQAFSGFTNQGFLTIAALYIVAAGLVRSGASFSMTQNIFGNTSNLRWAQFRMSVVIALLSAVVNNTAVIASLLANVRDWARAHNVSQSQLLIPMSYAAMLGGNCSLFGSSTNVVVFGLLLASGQTYGLGIFDIAAVGIPIVVFGILYMILFANRILPNKTVSEDQLNTTLKEYSVEAIVEAGSPVVGKTISQAGLRNLEGLYLAEIQRSDSVLSAVGPQIILMANDRLVFVGDTNAIIDLRKIKGLSLLDTVSFPDSTQRVFVEVIVAQNSQLVGLSIRESAFRSNFNAAILAVSRHGQRLKGRIGDIVIAPSDALLLECDESFVSRFGKTSEFLLASNVENSELPNFEKAKVAIFILLAMLLAASSGVMSFFNASILAAGAMLLTRCVTGREARDSIDMVVMLSIGLSFGLAEAVNASGLAEVLTNTLENMDSLTPFALLASAFVFTSVLTSLITNTSAAILVLPTILGIAETMSLSPLPFAIAVMVAASASFALPTGYQTNLMVYSVGGYTVGDFFRFGMPLQVLVFVIAMVMIPIVWPLQLI